MDALLASFFLILLAEMGDKTQLLAMSFALRYPARKVMLGVLLGSLASQALAVAAGYFFSSFIPLRHMTLLASLVFIGFGVWTLWESQEEEKPSETQGLGAVFTVFWGFFLAEAGDKTQLATFALAAQYAAPFLVLAGAALGMTLANGIGLAAGIFLKKHLPEKKIRLAAGILFIVLGAAGLLRVALTSGQA